MKQEHGPSKSYFRKLVVTCIRNPVLFVIPFIITSLVFYQNSNIKPKDSAIAREVQKLDNDSPDIKVLEERYLKIQSLIDSELKVKLAVKPFPPLNTSHRAFDRQKKKKKPVPTLRHQLTLSLFGSIKQKTIYRSI